MLDSKTSRSSVSVPAIAVSVSTLIFLDLEDEALEGVDGWEGVVDGGGSSVSYSASRWYKG